MFGLNLHILVEWLVVLYCLDSIQAKHYLNNFNWANPKSVKNGRICSEKYCAYVHSKYTHVIHMHPLLKWAVSAHSICKYDLYPEKLCIRHGSSLAQRQTRTEFLDKIPRQDHKAQEALPSKVSLQNCHVWSLLILRLPKFLLLIPQIIISKCQNLNALFILCL